MDEKEIKEVIEKEVQGRVNERLQEIREEKESEIHEIDEKSFNTSEKISRRSFLRKLGAGTISLGAVSLIPASTLNVRSDGFSFYGGSGSALDLDIDNSGNVQIYGDLTSKDGKTLWDESNDHIPSDIIQTTGLDADTIDGKEASELGGKNVQMDRDGNFYIKNKRTYLTRDLRTAKYTSIDSNQTSTTTTINGLYGTNMGLYALMTTPFSDSLACTIYKNGNTIATDTGSNGVVLTTAYTNVKTNDELTARFYVSGGGEGGQFTATVIDDSFTFSSDITNSVDVGWLYANLTNVNIGKWPTIKGRTPKRNDWQFTDISTNNSLKGSPFTFSNPVSFLGDGTSGQSSLTLYLFEGSFV